MKNLIIQQMKLVAVTDARVSHEKATKGDRSIAADKVLTIEKTLIEWNRQTKRTRKNPATIKWKGWIEHHCGLLRPENFDDEVAD
jgi:hypothetical protein